MGKAKQGWAKVVVRFNEETGKWELVAARQEDGEKAKPTVRGEYKSRDRAVLAAVRFLSIDLIWGEV